jgi:predicted adenylyl cyclase CyaB
MDEDQEFKVTDSLPQTLLELEEAEKAKPKEFLEVEYKYDASCIDRMIFKDLVKTFNPKSFIYVESSDIYYAKSKDEFLRYRKPSENKLSGEENRQELTFKKKSVDKNNWTRIEVNLRIDLNDPFLVHSFCEGLGYKKNFEIVKSCDIYFFEDGDLVYYSVKDQDGKYKCYIEIEAVEDCGHTREQSLEILQKYEKMLAPLGITAQNRKRLSLWEMYRKGF